jgi:DNA-binding XRE family transcriptional regulator
VLLGSTLRSQPLLGHAFGGWGEVSNPGAVDTFTILALVPRPERNLHKRRSIDNNITNACHRHHFSDTPEETPIADYAAAFFHWDMGMVRAFAPSSDTAVAPDDFCVRQGGAVRKCVSMCTITSMKPTPRRINEAFSKLARAIRVQAGITQCELARRTGLGRSHFSLVESGQRGATLTTLVVLAKAYEVKPSTFMRRLERVLSL